MSQNCIACTNRLWRAQEGPEEERPGAGQEDEGGGVGDAGRVRASAETKVTITCKCYRQAMRSHVPNAEPWLTGPYDAEETMMP